MTDLESVLAANRDFYRAFESLDLGLMEAVWLNAPHVKCVHPGWNLIVGYGPVMDSWQRIFTHTRAMHFELVNVKAEVAGDLAWVVLTELIETRSEEGIDRGMVQATNVFERFGGRWWMVHHHGSPIYLPPGEAGPERMH